MSDELKAAVDVLSDTTANMEARRDAAWIVALHYLAERAERERREAERTLPVDKAWLRSIGGLQATFHSEFTTWRLPLDDSQDQEPFLDDEFTHVMVCSDGSACVECYDEHGNSLEIVDIGFYRTRGHVLDLLKALGVKP